MAIADYYTDFLTTTSVSKEIRVKANSPDSGFSDDARFLLYEAIFLRVFRAYENFLEEVFLCYLTGERDMSGNAVTSFLTPTDRYHARKMVASSQSFLDWTSPSVVMERSQIYIDGGDPIRTAVASSQQHLQQAKKIRNHIAHNSQESKTEYTKVVQNILLTLPLQLPSVGEFLMKIPTAGPAKRTEVLDYFMSNLESTVKAVAKYTPPPA